MLHTLGLVGSVGGCNALGANDCRTTYDNEIACICASPCCWENGAVLDAGAVTCNCVGCAGARWAPSTSNPTKRPPLSDILDARLCDCRRDPTSLCELDRRSVRRPPKRMSQRPCWLALYRKRAGPACATLLAKVSITSHRAREFVRCVDI